MASQPPKPPKPPAPNQVDGMYLQTTYFISSLSATELLIAYLRYGAAYCIYYANACAGANAYANVCAHAFAHTLSAISFTISFLPTLHMPMPIDALTLILLYPYCHPFPILPHTQHDPYRLLPSLPYLCLTLHFILWLTSLRILLSVSCL